MTNPVIAKFSALEVPEVAEQLDITWDEWLTHLSKAPTRAFAGKMEHGGWSPVVYDPPTRAKANIKAVSALVLDYDKGGSWERIHEAWQHAYGLMYTTKSHGAPDAVGDRLRVVLPLERAVSADEYAKIWEWAARMSHDFGCPADKNAKDASRFWYDPSMPPGGWRSQLLAGKPIDPEVILALPEPSPRLRVVRPTQAPNLNDRERRAKAYLEKIPGAVSGDAGHTATFNAVAAMMFGFDLDAGTTFSLIDSFYNPRCSPPWSERELEHKIASVAKKCTRERGYLLVDRPRIDSTKQAATYAPEAPAELDVDWSANLIVTKKLIPKKSYHNTLVFIRHHPDYRGKWTLDTMTGTPWFNGEPMLETFVHDLRSQIEQKLGFTPSTQDVEAAITTAAQDRKFHPIHQYLKSLDWDGTPRLTAMASDYLGSSEAHHAIMVRKFMIGAAARALWPGCKQDTALMLSGPQGIGKSTFFTVLGGNWHADSFIDITNKDSFVQIHSAWIYELAELENVVHGRAESRLKAWMTSTHDLYRPPFAKNAQRRARAVVICGTTNRTQFLTDSTGSRRFWIVPVAHGIDREMLKHARDQLWAEAFAAAESGEQWWLDADTARASERANADFLEEDAWTSVISEWLEGRDKVTVNDVLTSAIKLDVARQQRGDQMRVASALVQAGWRRVRGARPLRSWVYVPNRTQTEFQS